MPHETLPSVTVAPRTLAPQNPIWLNYLHSIIFRPGTIDMYVDAPVPTAGLGDEDMAADLMNEVRAAMLLHFPMAKRQAIRKQVDRQTKLLLHSIS